MKILIIFAFILTFSAIDYAQCKQTIADLPVVRGLKIGMSSSEVQKFYPRAIVNKENNIGLTNITATSADVKDRELKKNLLGITLYLQDGKAAKFSIIYDDSIKWASLNAFVQPISDTLNIPMDAWTFGADYATAKCEGFVARASIGRFTSLTIEIANYDAINSQRRKDAESKKKESFKP